MLNDSSICTRRGLDTQPVNSYNQSRGARGARGASAARGTTGQVTRDSLSEHYVILEFLMLVLLI